MQDSTANKLIIAAVVFFAGAAIFGGASWLQLSKTNQTGALQPLAGVSGESSIPHYPAGNINGAVASVTSNSVTVTVPPLAGTSMSTTSIMVLVDSDTEIYKMGAPKDQSVYEQEQASYLSQRSSNPNAQAPDPFTHVAVPLAQLTAGTAINILPKNGSVQGTTLHAQTIMVQSSASTTAQ